MAKVDDLEGFHPLSREEWRDWLAHNHDKEQGVWLVYFKKATGKPRVTVEEAVEEALCFGWIDSLQRKIDDERTRLLFTPRKPKSVWSKVNKARVEQLIESNLMTEAGMAKIEAAKANGAWNALDRSDAFKIEDDLAEAFAANESARVNFEKFSPSVKKAILFWIYAAKTIETRTKRIEKMIRMAEKNLRANYDRED